MTKIYLAGKIARTDWRHGLFRGLRAADPDDTQDRSQYLVRDGFEFTGPFFISDHGCYHGESTHGRGTETFPCCLGYEAETRAEVYKMCVGWLMSADVVFVWLDDLTAYGTLVEIGIAIQQGIPTFVAVKTGALLDIQKHLWLALAAANYCCSASNASDAWEVFVKWFREMEKSPV